MKSFSIIAVALFALVALCSSVPVLNQPVESDLQARIDIYNDFLAGLFSGLVQTTFGSVSNFLNQLISTNPLGVGKRDVEGDVAARISALSFLYDNILQDFFSGLVTNTFGTISNTLNNLIQTNPLGVGKREVEGDLVARVNALSFLYDNILQDLFSGLVTNTFGTIGSALNNLIQTNPLGIGKRDVDGDVAARLSALSFLYDNILQDFFSGLVTNTFSTLSSTLTNLIQTNPLGVGKRSINFDQIEAIVRPTATVLIQKFKTFVHQALSLLNNKPALAQLVQTLVADIKATVAGLAQQLSQVIPSTITNQVSQVLAGIQSVLVFWSSGLAGSLGPVIGPFRP